MSWIICGAISFLSFSAMGVLRARRGALFWFSCFPVLLERVFIFVVAWWSECLLP